MSQLKKDVAFLKDNNSIDYSLLIGIHLIELNKIQKDKENKNIKPEENFNQKSATHSPLIKLKKMDTGELNNIDNIENKPEIYKKEDENAFGTSINEYNVIMNIESEFDNVNNNEKDIHTFNTVIILFSNYLNILIFTCLTFNLIYYIV